MDVNGSRHWGLHGPGHWPLDPAAAEQAALVWQRCPRARHGALQLGSGLAPGGVVPHAASPSQVRAALDAEGALLWWDGARLVSAYP